MNRSQRRINEKSNQNKLRINIKQDELNKIRKQAVSDATEKALLLVMALPLMALRDEFGFGKKRLERFSEKMEYLLDSFDKGYITIQDLHDCLKEEVGVEIKF